MMRPDAADERRVPRLAKFAMLGAGVALLVGILWFGFGKDPSIIPSPLIGKPAPGFTLKTAAGTPLSLRTLRGRPVVLSFFASWCTTCIAEESNMVRAWSQWKHKVAFVGVAFGQSVGDAAKFLRSYGGRWPDLADPGDYTALNYGVNGLPTTFFINRRGVITGYTVSLAPAVLARGIAGAVKA